MLDSHPNTNPHHPAPTQVADQPRVEQREGPAGTVWWVLGRWTAAELANVQHWKALQASWPSATSGRQHSAWNLTAATTIDHVGAQLLWGHIYQMLLDLKIKDSL